MDNNDTPSGDFLNISSVLDGTKRLKIGIYNGITGHDNE